MEGEGDGEGVPAPTAPDAATPAAATGSAAPDRGSGRDAGWQLQSKT